MSLQLVWAKTVSRYLTCPVFCIFLDLFRCFLSFSKLHLKIIPLNASHQCLLKLQCICCPEFQRPEKQQWEKANYCLNFPETRYVRNLKVWSRIMNDPRRMNSRRCADSLRDIWADTCMLLWEPDLWDSLMLPSLPGFSLLSTLLIHFMLQLI